MATTTNYGWDTPDDTDLVKDGAAAIRTLGSSVDTTTKALNPSTTEGDIEYRSATANTNTRLALGTAGQVLQVNSGANAPEWATPSSGGMTVITSGTLSGAAVNLTSIPSTYNDLYLVLTNATTSATNKAIYLRFNNISTANTYYAQNGTVQAFDATFGDTEFTIGAYGTGTSNSLIFTYIPSYANSTTRKLAYGQEFRNGATTNTDIVWRWRLGLHSPTTAISEINILPESGTFSSGSYTLYGVK
jgi:hypothetical protein